VPPAQIERDVDVTVGFASGGSTTTVVALLVALQPLAFVTVTL
jgi:hypothetical protein